MTPKTTVTLQFAPLPDVPDAALHRAALPRAQVTNWVRHALASPGEISVRIVSQAEGRSLNQQYRGKDYATNVLTFHYAVKPVVMADLVLCAAVVAREAQEQGKTLQAHYAHLIVHGTLHAQGYDHEAGDRGALEMEALEVLLMGALGFDNPY